MLPTFTQEQPPPGVNYMRIDTTFLVIPFIIFIVAFISALSVSYYKLYMKNKIKPMPEFKKRPGVSLSYANNHIHSKVALASKVLLRLNKNNDNIMLAIKSSEISEVQDELTMLSEDFLKKVDQFNWEDDEQKLQFINEMLTLTPEERNEVIGYMFGKSEKNEIF
jgi:hypothetical protein